MKDIFIIIPTLNPNIKLLDNLLKDLKKEFKNILIYNDGSRSEYDKYFKEKEQKDKIIILKHFINLGKGRAMKDAFNYLLNNYPNLKGVITVDSDGQHGIKDIKKCAKAILNHSDSLILGCRNFNSKNVPKRNMMGNKITCNVFKIFVGLNISDTQTGLRGLPKEVMIKFIDTSGERFEYETNQLIETKEKDVPIIEIPIETIYGESVSESHFNPIKDSIAIYKLFLKFIFSALSSFIIDIFLFSLFLKIFTGEYHIILATILSRLISSIYNYLINSKLVFKKNDKTSVIKYFMLCIIQMNVSALCVQILNNIFTNFTLLIKIIVDLIIFLSNYIIQREIIFKNGKKRKN